MTRIGNILCLTLSANYKSFPMQTRICFVRLSIPSLSSLLQIPPFSQFVLALVRTLVPYFKSWILGSVFPTLNLSHPGAGVPEEGNIIGGDCPCSPINSVRKVAVAMLSVTRGFKLSKLNLSSTLFFRKRKNYEPHHRLTPTQLRRKKIDVVRRCGRSSNGRRVLIFLLTVNIQLHLHENYNRIKQM